VVEVAAALFHQRAVVRAVLEGAGGCRGAHQQQVSQLEAGVMIYLSTPVYTNENEVITNLGTNIKVYAGDIVVVYS
jgi:aspartate/tyrosine/aromatic aminotransferase